MTKYQIQHLTKAHRILVILSIVGFALLLIWFIWSAGVLGGGNNVGGDRLTGFIFLSVVTVPIYVASLIVLKGAWKILPLVPLLVVLLLTFAFTDFMLTFNLN